MCVHALPHQKEPCLRMNMSVRSLRKAGAPRVFAQQADSVMHDSTMFIQTLPLLKHTPLVWRAACRRRCRASGSQVSGLEHVDPN